MKYSLLALILLPVSAIAQPVAKADLTLRARAILRKHCGDCHGGDATQLGEFAVGSRAEMDRPQRPFLLPGDPDASQIIDLIEAGNMPPGKRPKVPVEDRKILREWISASAPSYPKQFNDDYVVAALTADLPKRPADDQRFQRYLSLSHLVEADTLSLELQRVKLKKTLGDLSETDAAIEPLDPAATVFRIDLRRLGWNATPFEAVGFTEGDEGGVKPGDTKKSQLNLFDLILLEYPFGRVFPKAEKVVESLRQVLPIPFVRADWLTDDFAKFPVAADLKPRVAGADHLWPKQAPVAKVGPIPPWDASTWPNFTPDPAPFSLSFEVVDIKTGQKKTKVKVNEPVEVLLKADKPIYFELILLDETGEVDVVSIFKADQNAPAHVKPAGFDGFHLDAPGKSAFVLYAGTVKFPSLIRHRDPHLTAFVDATDAAKEKKKPGPEMTGKWFADRLVHPAWTATGPVENFDPKQIIKRTIEIEITK